MASQTVELTHRVAAPQPPEERARLERRARLLAWGGNSWHVVEFAIAVGAGIVAGSVALIGFGIDSLIESLAAFVIVWLFTGGRGSSEASERRAQRMIAASYFVLVAYIGVEASRDLLGGHHPQASWVGIGLAAFTAPTMPLARPSKAERRPEAQLLRDGERGRAKHDLRLSVGCAPRRAPAECSGRMVVGRPPPQRW